MIFSYCHSIFSHLTTYSDNFYFYAKILESTAYLQPRRAQLQKNILPNSMLDRIFNPILYFELLLEVLIRKLNILRPIVRIDVVLAGTDMVSHIALM